MAQILDSIRGLMGNGGGNAGNAEAQTAAAQPAAAPAEAAPAGEDQSSAMMMTLFSNMMQEMMKMIDPNNPNGAQPGQTTPTGIPGQPGQTTPAGIPGQPGQGPTGVSTSTAPTSTTTPPNLPGTTTTVGTNPPITITTSTNSGSAFPSISTSSNGAADTSNPFAKVVTA